MATRGGIRGADGCGTDDEDETPAYTHRNICAILAQDAPKSMAA